MMGMRRYIKIKGSIRILGTQIIHILNFRINVAFVWKSLSITKRLWNSIVNTNFTLNALYNGSETSQTQNVHCAKDHSRKAP
jgi:hypothetical protein